MLLAVPSASSLPCFWPICSTAKCPVCAFSAPFTFCPALPPWWALPWCGQMALQRHHRLHKLRHHAAHRFIQHHRLAPTEPQIRWLSESNTALLAVIIMAAWQWIGFNTVLFLAGLQNIPRSLYEAATVDGATPRQQFWKVTLPLLGPTTFFVVTTTVIQAMQVFEQVFIIMGQNPAGPSNSTLTIVLYLYQKGFQRFEQGYASAIAWVLFLLIFAATLVQFQRQRTSGSSYEG
ncbi:MAG: sugar ABC transporter permease [Chloroflexota bacterium]